MWRVCCGGTHLDHRAATMEGMHVLGLAIWLQGPEQQCSALPRLDRETPAATLCSSTRGSNGTGHSLTWQQFALLAEYGAASSSRQLAQQDCMTV